MLLEDMQWVTKVETNEKKDPIKQLEARSKVLSTSLRFLVLGFNTKTYVKKYKPNGEMEFRPVYFNSTTKTVINHKFSLENAFQETLYRVDNWINEGCSWVVELIKSQYINISTYRLFSESSYVKLPAELKSPRKELINIKKQQQNNQKCFL